MAIEITRPGKHTLIIETPVMPAAGTFGYGDVYRGLVDTNKLGAIITNPVTVEPWSPTQETRVVPLDAGVLVHTGLPNPGIKQVIAQHRSMWAKMTVPIIMHVVATSPKHIAMAAALLDTEVNIAAMELGLSDDISEEDAFDIVQAATTVFEKPVLVRLPMYDAYAIAAAIVEADASALVVAGAPRGMAPNPHNGRMVQGRLYGPMVKPMVLQMVDVLVKRYPEIPIIAAGGIHSPKDARDYLEVGARAVQVDSVIWVEPKMLERIAADLGGWLVTQQTRAIPDEWRSFLDESMDEIASQEDQSGA